ncbi:hypothetical protein Trisim1_000552 [Trichoderma cf. simile WF8]
MADAHEQAESSTAYSGTIRLNKRALEQKVDTFLDKDEEEYNSRKKAFLDIIREETHREGKNEQDIQAHIIAAESIMAMKRQGRACYHRLEPQEKRKNVRNEEDKIKNGRIKKDKIKKNKIENDKIENDKIENDKIENDKIENDKIENDKIENDKIENDKIENDKIENDKIEEGEIEEDKVEKERNEIDNWFERYGKDKILMLVDQGNSIEYIRLSVVRNMFLGNIGEEYISLISDKIRAISAQMETGNGQTRND